MRTYCISGHGKIFHDFPPLRQPQLASFWDAIPLSRLESLGFPSKFDKIFLIKKYFVDY
jgi:hypothetical protein